MKWLSGPNRNLALLLMVLAIIIPGYDVLTYNDTFFWHIVVAVTTWFVVIAGVIFLFVYNRLHQPRNTMQ